MQKESYPHLEKHRTLAQYRNIEAGGNLPDEIYLSVITGQCLPNLGATDQIKLFSNESWI